MKNSLKNNNQEEIKRKIKLSDVGQLYLLKNRGYSLTEIADIIERDEETGEKIKTNTIFVKIKRYCKKSNLKMPRANRKGRKALKIRFVDDFENIIKNN